MDEIKINRTQFQEILINAANGTNRFEMPGSDQRSEELNFINVGINMLMEELKAETMSRSFFNSIYNGINDMIVVIDKNGIIQNSNEVTQKTLGYSELELLEESVKKIIQAESLDLFNNAVRNLNDLIEFGLNFITSKNKIIPFSCSLSVLNEEYSKTDNVLLVAKNISAVLEAKHQLSAKNDELNLFVYKTSHDLKSPISSMQGLMYLVSQSNDKQELKEYYYKVNECVIKLDSIIKELLVLGRITYGELKYGMVDTKNTIDSILKSLEFVNGFKQVAFHIKISDDARMIRTEEGLLTTVFFNLIDNAIKYRYEKVNSYLNLEVTKVEEEIVITVKDNGIGIDKTAQPNLFKMFFRATNECSGSGLGLYIVKTSVEKLGGTIAVESELRKGTSFEIRLPVLE